MTAGPSGTASRLASLIRGLRAAPAVLLVLAVVAMLAPAANAQETEGEAQADTGTEARVTAVDATGENVEFSLIGVDPATTAADVTLVVEGSEAEVVDLALSSTEGRPTELVVIVDTKLRGVNGDVLAKVKEELSAATELLPDNTAVAIVSAGDSALVHTKLTTDIDKIVAAIDELSVRNASSLFDAIERSAMLFGSDPATVKSMMIIATGPDQGSSASLAEAQVRVLQQGAQVVSVAYQGGEPDLEDTVLRTGGITMVIDSSDQVAAGVGEAVTVATERLLVSYQEPEDVNGRVGVDLTVGDQLVEFSYPTGVVTASALQLTPEPESTDGGFTFFSSSAGLWVAVVLAFIGISMGVWALGSIILGGDATLAGVLARYTAEGSEQSEEEVEELIVQSALLQRAVTFSETFAKKQGFLARVEDLLERANLPIRAGEAMFILAAVTVLSGLFGLAATGNVVVAILLVASAVGLSFFVVRFLGRRRFKAFEAQLPDTLQLLSGTLRAGYSLPQGLEAVANEVADPMGGELRRAMTEARLGRDLEGCLGGVAERLDSADFAWAVMAIGIQREVGGNLNELLMSVADTMTARERLKREIAALTAEGKVSAAVLSFLPPGLGLVMYFMNPAYVGVLFTETIGNILLGLGLVSALTGLAWMKKVVAVDV